MNGHFFPLIIGSCAFILTLPNAFSGMVTLTTQNSVVNGQRNQGWWSLNQAHNPANYLYLTGNFGTIGGGPYSQYRSHFSFNLSGITETVVSAQLQLTRFASVGRETTDRLGVPINDIFSGVNQQLSVFDVSTDANLLNTFSGISSSIYSDLGSGTLFGTYSELQTWNPDGILTINLNADALNAINNNRGSFSLGLSLNSGITQNNYMFGGTGGAYNGVQSLVLVTAPIPEPSSACVGIGLTLACLLPRRRARSKAEGAARSECGRSELRSI